VIRVTQQGYTLESLEAVDARFVSRTPGVQDVIRLFPEPASKGRGSLGVEGGITLVGGPGLGKTSLLKRLARSLEDERGIATALLAMPKPEANSQMDGFYKSLGAIVVGAREALSRSAAMAKEHHKELRRAIEKEPSWDAGAKSFTPRGLANWVAALGQAATHAGGICLLVDDVDVTAETSWKAAFVAALRFTFQSASGITPIYAAWKLFLDESLPGSNYFRNVTRPVFLEPFARGGERLALAEQGLTGLASPAREKLFALGGGHPRLLQQLLGDVAQSLDGKNLANVDLPSLEVAAFKNRPAQLALIAALVRGSREIEATLKQIQSQPYVYEKLPKVVVSTGLVDIDERGHAVLPELIAEHLKQKQ